MPTRTSFVLARIGRTLRVSLVILLAMLAPIHLQAASRKIDLPFVRKASYTVGIAFVPIASDSAEEKLNKAVGRDPHIDFVYHVRTPNDIFRVMAEYRRKGVAIDYLAIGGHGGLTEKEANPKFLGVSLVGINLAGFTDGNFDGKDIDIQSMKREVTRAKDMLRSIRGRNDPHAYRLRQANEAIIRNYTDKVRLLNEAAMALAPDATIVLLSCNALDTPTGVRFVKDLGKLLLGNKGGTIWATRGKHWLLVPPSIINFFDSLLVAAWSVRHDVPARAGTAGGTSVRQARNDAAEAGQYVAWIHESIRTCCPANFGGKAPYRFNGTTRREVPRGARILENKAFATRSDMVRWVCNRRLKRWAFYAVGISGVIDGRNVTQLPCETN
ncbi:MAG: hypothetical protein H6934_03380 [Burkholderiaceae bacterium]|nr:hypothetical protein [Burkholderiaceae bacterium]